jgi:prepilin-type N-terminal cleavage/methylation domain-containing protein
MKSSNRAFTLIELMAVIIILGVLSSLAIPSYRKIIARTKQERMKNTLRLVAKYEDVFFVQNEYYAPGKPGVESYTFELFHDGSMIPEEVDLSKLPFVFPDNRNYDYRIYWVSNAEEHYFYAQSIASIGRGNDIDGDAKMDQWQVSSYNLEPAALSNDLGSEGTVEEEEGEEEEKEKKEKEKEKKKEKKKKEKKKPKKV